MRDDAAGAASAVEEVERGGLVGDEHRAESAAHDRVGDGVLGGPGDHGDAERGAADHNSVHVESGYLSTADVDVLVQKGAVGDVVGRYIDSDGNIVDPALDARTVGLTLDELRESPLGIAVIAGSAKHAVADAVVRSRLCSVLVTDESTALHLLDG